MGTTFNRLKNMLRRMFNKIGVDIFFFTKKETLAGFTYEPIQSIADFAPWNMDQAFQECFRAIKDHTLVDKYRCYELWALVEQSHKLSDGALIEVGVWRGGSGAIIAKKARSVGIPDPVYLCDTFRGVVKASSEDITYYRGGEHADTSQEIVEQLIFSQLGLDNVIVLKGIFPDETAHLIANRKFRFCHIDVDTYQSAKDIVNWIWGKMVAGGMIIFDDYGFKYCEGVTKYVEELRGLSDRVLIHNLNGHAILIKTHE
jgi:O-methyltransferase